MGKKSVRITQLLLLLAGIRFVGFLLDLEAERVTDQLYDRDKNDVIKGLGTQEHVNGHKKALIWLHGFQDTPEAFASQLAMLRKQDLFDVYVPLQPYRGRTLQALANISNNVVLDFLEKYCAKVAATHEHVVIVGLSYGGAALLGLHHQQRLPNNVTLVLQSPAIYVQWNSFWGNVLIRVYGLWRKYANYPSIGAQTPSFDSGDAHAREFIRREKSLRYKAIPAVKFTNKLDDAYRDELANLTQPFYVIMAKDDNRVHYDKIYAKGMRNPNCHFYSFPSGSHMVHWSKFRHEILDLFTNIVLTAPQVYQPEGALRSFYSQGRKASGNGRHGS